VVAMDIKVKNHRCWRWGYLIFQKFENNDYISEIISETHLDLGFILAKGLGFRPGKQFFFSKFEIWIFFQFCHVVIWQSSIRRYSQIWL
jgi:hypothetical protein